MTSIIVAYDKNRLIGGNNSLLWQGEMGADITRFRDITTGTTIIMGRKTFESIGRPLPNRQNIVITHKSIEIPGVEIAQSLDEAYKLARPDLETFIIGGGEIFSQAIDQVDSILATEIEAEFKGDIYFPKLTDNWIEVFREFHTHDDKNKFDYSYVTYAKRQ